jgi:hypothetical protein
LAVSSADREREMHNRKSVWRGVEEERDRLTKILDEVKAAGIWLTDPPARESIPSFIATRSGKH